MLEESEKRPPAALRTAREPWIDTARCIMIFAIVWAHVLGHTGADRLSGWLSNFHVPMSLMISGMVITYRKGGFAAFVKKRFIRLMIPYYCFSCISIAVYTVVGDRAESAVGGVLRSFSTLDYFLGMLYANCKTGAMRWNAPLWYIPMSFVMSMPAYWAARETRIKYVFIQFIVSVAIAYGVYMTGPAVMLPFQIETVLCSFPLVIMGRLLRMAYERFRGQDRRIRLAASVLLVVGGTLLQFQNTFAAVVGDVYGNYFLFLPSAGMTAAGLILLASLKEKGVPVLCHVGRSTLSILLMHKFPVMFLIVVIPPVRGLLVSRPVVTSLFISVITILLCLLAERMICLAAPWAVGKRKGE